MKTKHWDFWESPAMGVLFVPDVQRLWRFAVSNAGMERGWQGSLYGLPFILTIRLDSDLLRKRKGAKQYETHYWDYRIDRVKWCGIQSASRSCAGHCKSWGHSAVAALYDESAGHR